MFFIISLILFYNLLSQFLEHLIFKIIHFIIFPIFTVLFNYVAFSPCFWLCIFADLVFSIHFTMGSFIVLISYFLTPVFTVIFVFFLSSFLFVSVWDYLGSWLLTVAFIFSLGVLSSVLGDLWNPGATVQGQAWTLEVRDTSTRLWTTRELVIMWNINWQELTERFPSQQ